MQKDAHYYCLLAFCRACGFKKESAQQVAYASQFIDDAKINLISFHDHDQTLPQYDLIEEVPVFFNMATCHSYTHIKTYNLESMINNTTAFHFVPGCKGECFTKKMRCKEESPVIRAILEEALLEDDLIKLGITLHPYADSFSHQGFSGVLSRVNDIQNCKPHLKVYCSNLDKFLFLFKNKLHSLDHKIKISEKYDQIFDLLVPAYGHGQAMTFPDIPYLEWSYAYDCSEEFSGCLMETKVDNKQRYRRAFEKIKKHLEIFLANHPSHFDREFKFQNTELLMETLFMEGSSDQRINNWKKVLTEHGFFLSDDQALHYTDDLWLKEAFANYNRSLFNHRIVSGAKLADHFLSSNWYRFYLAVKWYKEKFFRACAENRLEIPL